MNRMICTSVAGALAAFSSLNVAVAQTVSGPPQSPSGSRHIAITLTIGADGSASLASAAVSPGAVQRERGAAKTAGDFAACLTDARGTALGTVQFDDPTRLRSEWSPDGRRIEGTNVQIPIGTVVLRFPYSPSTRRLQLLRRVNGAAAGGARSNAVRSLPRLRQVAMFDIDIARAGVSPPPPYTTETIVNNGPSENRLDIVFLGDGYTSSQLAKFRSDVLHVIDEFSAASPYDGFPQLINFHLVNVVSNQSGIDDPNAGVFRDTALDLSFNIGGTQRCVYTVSAYKVYAAAALVPGYDKIFVIANDPQYGGCGGNFACFTTDPAAGEIAIHEFGHSFGLLADEYGGGGNPPTEEPAAVNATIARSLSGLAAAGKWDYWVPSGQPIPTPAGRSGVGLFEGAVYTDFGAYRPVDNCRMRVLGVPYCPICIEQLTRRLHVFADPVDTFSTTPAIVPMGERVAVSTEEPPGGASQPDLDVTHVGIVQTSDSLRLSLGLGGDVPDANSDSAPYYVFVLDGDGLSTSVYMSAASRRVVIVNDNIPYEELGMVDVGSASLSGEVPLNRLGNPAALRWHVYTVDSNDNVQESIDGSQFSVVPLNQVIVNAGESFMGTGAPLSATGATYSPRWLVDGVPASTGGSYSASAADLGSGVHTVRFEVSATSPLVRRDPDHTLESARELSVAVCTAGPKITKVKLTLTGDGKVKLTGKGFKAGSTIRVNGLALTGSGQVKKQGKVFQQTGPLSNGLPLSSVLVHDEPASILVVTGTGACSAASVTP